MKRSTFDAIFTIARIKPIQIAIKTAQNLGLLCMAGSLSHYFGCYLSTFRRGFARARVWRPRFP
jgi:hypothetical protein